MSDDVTGLVAQNRKQRQAQDPAFLKALEEARAFAAEDQKAAEAKAAAPKPVPAVDPQTTAPKKNESGFLGQTMKSIAGGGLDAMKEVVDLAEDFTEWSGRKYLDARFDEDFRLSSLIPTTDKQTGTGQGFIRGATQFLLPFGAYMKALKGVQVATRTGQFAKAAGAGAAADFSAFDPHEKRLSNLINEKMPALQSPITDYLAAKDDDSVFEGRLKNAIEGFGFGLAAEGIFLGFRTFAKSMKAQGKTMPAPEKKAAAAEAPKALPSPQNAKGGKVAAKAPGADPAAEYAKRAEEQTLADRVEALYAERAAEEVRVREAMRADGRMRDGTPMNPEVGPPTSGAGREMGPPRPSEEVGPPVTAAGREVGPPSGAAPAPEGVPLLSNDTAVRAEGPKILDETGMQYRDDAEPLVRQTIDEFYVTRAKELEAQRAAEDVRVTEAMRADGRLRDGTPIRPEVGPPTDAAGREMGPPEPLMGDMGPSVPPQAGLGGKQGGSISPTLAAQLGGPAAGAIIGAATTEDGASMNTLVENILAGAAVGAGFGYGASKLLRQIDPDVAAKVDIEEEVARDLARPLVANVAPLTERAKLVKPSPSVRKKQVDGMIEALTKGDASTLAKMVKESDFNFDRLDTTEDIKEMIDAFSAQFEKSVDTATRGKQTMEQMRVFAKEIGTSPETLRELYKDTGFLAERVWAHRSLMMASSEKLRGMANHLRENPHDMTALLAFRKHVMVHAEIQARMKGTQTEIARALAAMRGKATAAEFKADEFSTLLESLGGYKANVELAKKLAQITDPARFNAVARKTAGARTADAIYEGWVNGILSGVSTAVVNGIGNAIVPVVNAVERTTAAAIGSGRAVFSKGVVEDRFRFGEVEQAARAYIGGMWDVLRIQKEGWGELGEAATLFSKGVVAGDSTYIQQAEKIISESDNLGNAVKTFFDRQPRQDTLGASQLESSAERSAISSGTWDFRPDTYAGAFIDYAGAAIRTPGRALMAMDEMFKTAMYRAEIRAQSYRKALNEGREGGDMQKRMTELMETPTPDMSITALEAARTGTFSNALGPRMSTLQALVAKDIPGPVPLLRFVLPFVRTPTNLIAWVGKRTPGLNALSQQVREDFMAGGARRDMVVAQTAMGTAIYSAGYMLKESGMVTGGGEKNQAAEKLGADQPYSIKIGDKWYAGNRMDPIAMPFFLAADLADLSGHISSREMDDLAVMGFLAIQRNLVSKSYLKGITDAVMATSDPERFGQGFVNRLAGSLIPAVVASGTREQDPYIKEVWNVVDAIKSRTPGFSKEVPNHVNILGEEVKFTDGWGPDFASPVKVQDTTQIPPVAREIARVNADLEHPPRSLRVTQGVSIDLTPQQYHRYMKLAGGIFKTEATKLIDTEQYKALPEVPDDTDPDYITGKQAYLKALWSNSLAAGRAQLLEEDKELRSKFELSLTNQGRVFQGLQPLPVQ